MWLGFLTTSSLYYCSCIMAIGWTHTYTSHPPAAHAGHLVLWFLSDHLPQSCSSQEACLLVNTWVSLSVGLGSLLSTCSIQSKNNTNNSRWAIVITSNNFKPLLPKALLDFTGRLLIGWTILRSCLAWMLSRSILAKIKEHPNSS